MPTQGTADERDDDSDWNARHARTRSRERRPSVADADDDEDAWELRHAATKRNA